MNEEEEITEITEILKGLTIKIGNALEYTITDKQAQELARELYVDGMRR